MALSSASNWRPRALRCGWTCAESLVEEGLEVLVARSTEEDPCPFCDPDKPGHCDLRSLLQSMLNELHR